MDNNENEVIDVEENTSENNGLKQESQIMGLFPKPVYRSHLGRAFTEDEMEFMKDLENECRPNNGNTTSANHYVLQKPVMSDINKIITREVNIFLQQLYSPQWPIEAYVTQSWLNYTKPGQYHHKHSHANSFLSGVLYINADPEKDKIFFFNDEKHHIFQITSQEFNFFNSQSWWIPVSTGEMVIFKSDLTHAVETVSADETRISLAFNTFLKGTIGHEDTLTGLKL